MRIRIIICTYNPNLEKLFLALTGIREQTHDFDNIEVIVIDNGSKSEISSHINKYCTVFNFTYTFLEYPSLIAARILGIETKTSLDPDYYLFVDDDNYLDSFYLKNGLKFLKENKQVGLVAGKSIPLKSLPTKNLWAHQYLAIRDLGNEPLLSKSDDWEICDPHGAGMLATKDACLVFLANCRELPEVFSLGRSGRSLNSGEDSYFAQLVKRSGMKTAYNPEMVLVHDIGADRLRMRYLLRLAKGMGASDGALGRIFNESTPIWVPRTGKQKLKLVIYELGRNEIKHALFKYMRLKERGKQ